MSFTRRSALTCGTLPGARASPGSPKVPGRSFGASAKPPESPPQADLHSDILVGDVEGAVLEQRRAEQHRRVVAEAVELGRYAERVEVEVVVGVHVVIGDRRV